MKFLLALLFIALAIIFNSSFMVKPKLYDKSLFGNDYAWPVNIHDQTLPLVDFPYLGKWMISEGLVPAHWLGYKYHGDNLIEPINMIFVVTGAKTKSQAIDFLIHDLELVGYAPRSGHSYGYSAFINNQLYFQIAIHGGYTFSNHIFFTENTHVRIFGPVLWIINDQSAYIFTASASVESEHFPTMVHSYVSFSKARDSITSQLSRQHQTTSIYYIKMHNELNNGVFTTGDHDGNSSVIFLHQD